MLETVKRCPECNAVCGENDTYCKKCGKSFVTKTAKNKAKPEAFFDPDETINDIPVYEIREKLQKNTDRYLKKFKENEDAKIFGSFNFAAALLSIHWFFYRRMYKIGILISLIIVIISNLAFGLGIWVYSGEYKTATEQKAEYQEAKEFVEDFYLYRDDLLNDYYYERIKDQNAQPPEEYKQYLEAQKFVQDYERKADNIVYKMVAFPFFAGVICNVAVGVFADCIYRNFLLDKKRERKGGLSRWWVYVPLANLVEKVVVIVGMMATVVIFLSVAAII